MISIYRVGCLCLLCLCLSTCSGVDEGTGTDTAIAIVHVNIVDVVDGTVKPDMTVCIARNRIKAIGKEEDVRTPSSARVVDGTHGG